MDTQRVVIIGAGFGGLTAAVRLATLGHDKDFSITLVDRNTHQLYTPLAYEVATGRAMPEESADENRREEHALSEGVTVPWDDLRTQFALHRINVENEEAVGVDWATSEVLLSDSRRLPFDHLVLAVGGGVDYFGIEGLAEHSHNLYSLRQALAIRRHLHGLVAQKRRKEIPFVRVLIGGAGPAGVEFAAELAMWMRKLVRLGTLSPSDYSIEIIEANSRPLPTFHKDLSAWARTRLEKLGVRLILDACIKGAHKDHVVLAPRPLRTGENADALLCDFRHEAQKEVNTDLLVWAGGVKASPLLAKIGLTVDRRGKVETDLNLRVAGKTNVWVIGDCASLTDPKTKLGVPPLAQAAVAQGKLVAENIEHAAHNIALVPYGFPRMNAIVPLGGAYGLADIYGFRFRGFVVGLFRRFADGRYFFGTFPFPQAWKIFHMGGAVYPKND